MLCSPWTTWDEITVCRDDLGDADEELQERVIDDASELLFLLSEGRYPGICTVTLEPCATCGWCGWHACGCEPTAGLDLTPYAPVQSVTEVVIDGEVLDPSTYALRASMLYRLDGSNWPRSTPRIYDPEAFRVTITYGTEPSPLARSAAAALAAEMAAACLNLSCGLRQNVRSVQREGKSYVFYDSSEMLAEGLTNVRATDAWLTAWRRSRVASPGMIDMAECTKLTVAGDTGAS